MLSRTGFYGLRRSIEALLINAFYVGLVTLAQFAFTYLPFMQFIFNSRSVAFLDGIAIVLVGVALLVVVEVEKFLFRLVSEMKWKPGGND